MPDPQGGLDFARGLLETALPYHNQLQQRDRDEQEREREGMLGILNAALKSDSLDPQAFPLLLEKALELQGAKGKDVKQYGDAFRSLLSGGFNAQGMTTTGYDKGGRTSVGSVDGQEYGFENDPAPIAAIGTVRRPLFQSPSEVARREANAAATKESALRTAREPFEIADDERRAKLEGLRIKARADVASARAQAQENLLIKRHGLKATEGIDALAAQIAAANPLILPEEAREQAAQRLVAKFESNLELVKAKIGFTNAVAGAIPQKLFFEGERVKQGWERVSQGWEGLSLREQTLALEEGYKQALIELKGNTKRQQEYAAKARPILDQIRQTEAQRASLERMLAGGLAVGDDAGKQVQTYSSNLTTLRDQLKTLTDSYTGSLETPSLNAGKGRDSAYKGRRISRAKLPEAAKRMGVSVEEAERRIAEAGGIVY